MKITMTAKKLAEYRLTQDAYSGDNGFADGSHLFKYEREEDFEKRKSMASYSNFLKPIVDARVDPVFVEEAKRVYKDNAILDAFIENADNNGTSLQEVIHNATTNTVLLGNDFLIVDNFPEDDIPQTQKEVLDSRKFPYVYSKGITDFIEAEADEFGKLLEITFYYGKYKGEKKTDIGKGEEVLLYKTFTENKTSYYYCTGKEYDSSKRVEISSIEHNLGTIPVVFYNKDVLPFPTYYSMSTIARTIYNEGSEIDDLRRAQAFAILLLPSTNPNGAAKDGVVTGTHNAIFFDSAAVNIPSFINPDPNTLKGLIENRSTDEKSLIQSADVLGTTALANGNSTSSGVAESYKFFGKKYALLESSGIASDLEEPVVALVALYQGNKDFEYSVKYPSSFAPTFAEVQAKIATLQEIISADVNDFVTAKAESDIIDLLAGVFNWSKEEIEKAKSGIVELVTVN